MFDFQELIGKKVINKKNEILNISTIKKRDNNSCYIILENEACFSFPQSFEENSLAFEDKSFEAKLSLKKVEIPLKHITKIPHYTNPEKDIIFKYRYISNKYINELPKGTFSRDIEIRNGIFKYGNPNSFEHKKWYEKFTRDFFDLVGVVIQSKITAPQEVFLVSVPGVSSQQTSVINKSIHQIVSWCNQGHFKETFHSDIKLLDASNTFSKDFTSIKNKAPHFDISETTTLDKETTAINRVLNKDSHIILLDVVSTIGSSMAACSELLIKKGISKENISKIAIAETYFYTPSPSHENNDNFRYDWLNL